MLYPKKIKSKTINRAFKIVVLVLSIVSIVLLIINRLTTPNIYWSHLCIFGFIYIYFTVRYSVTRNKTVSRHIMFQSILLALLLYFIDYRIGFKGWSAEDDLALFDTLNEINQQGSRFALSNVITHKGVNNEPLIDWAEQYNIHFINNNYNNSNYQSRSRQNETQEVLITNF